MRKTSPAQPHAAARSSSFSLAPEDIDVDTEEPSNHLGQGGFGAVYKGQYQLAPAAIKQLLLTDLSARELKEFVQEAQIMASLHHPNIVQLYGFTETKPYRIVMQYMPKGSLYKVLRSEEDLSWSGRATWGIEIAAGLNYLHTREPAIIHRDLKSLNVLISKDNEAKLTDFGLALSKLRSSTATVTGGKQQDKGESQSAVGSTRWMAPELFALSPKYSEASDIFALAIVLWELAAREIPYASQSSDSAIRGAIKEGERAAIESSWPEVLQILIERCWDQKPEKRPSAREAVAALQKGLKEISASETRERESASAEKASEAVAVMQLQRGRAPAAAAVAPAPSRGYAAASTGPAAASTYAFNSGVPARDEAPPIPARRPQTAAHPAPPAAAAPGFFAAKPDARVLVAAVGQQGAARAPAVDQAAVEQLLLHVARGEQDEAEGMLKGNAALLLHRGKVTDYSNRTFKKITAFQYALWALDWHMWTMLLKYLPQEEAKTQCQELERQGTEHGVHYDFTELLQALKTYVDKYDSWNGEQCNKHWNEVVGGAQMRVAAHVANEYCHPTRAFHPTPSFDDALPRSFNLDGGNKFYPMAKYSYGELGKNFALLRFNFDAGVAGGG